MWPLPVEDLFMVGRATAPKLHNLNINTIGDLAKYDLETLKYKLKSHGQVIWNFANGIELSKVRKSNYIEMKGIGNSTTISFDVEDKDTAYRVLLYLCETVAMRLRDSQNCCSVVSVNVRGSDLISYSHQKKLISILHLISAIWTFHYFDPLFRILLPIRLNFQEYYTTTYYFYKPITVTKGRVFVLVQFYVT
jgi:nucleotidyltransferase/DNA polymerase involved in DNA repair